MARRKFHKIEFVVRGDSGFPTDMLRYDACYPESEEDSGKIDRSNRHEEGPFMIRLRSQDANVIRNGPTDDRWRSRGWQVVANTVTVYTDDGTPYPFGY